GRGPAPLCGAADPAGSLHAEPGPVPQLARVRDATATARVLGAGSRRKGAADTFRARPAALGVLGARRAPGRVADVRASQLSAALQLLPAGGPPQLLSRAPAGAVRHRLLVAAARGGAAARDAHARLPPGGVVLHASGRVPAHAVRAVMPGGAEH